jgi:hypothetical protein
MANNTPGAYVPLEPSFTQSLGLTSPTFNAGQSASLLSSTTFLYGLGLMLCIAAAGVMYIVGSGYLIVASDQAQRKGKDILLHTSKGLFGVVCLFVLIYTFNKDLLSGDVGLDRLRSQPIAGSTVGATGGSGTSTASSTTGGVTIPANNDDPTGWGAIRDDPAMRAQLAALPNGGISVNKSVCINPTQTSCTTVGGWPSQTPSMLAQLRSACSGTITVSGGTEAGHSSHGPGKAPVDLGYNNDQLNSCIAGFAKSSRVPKRTNGSDLCYPGKVFENFGFIFCDEAGTDRHWHVYQ